MRIYVFAFELLSHNFFCLNHYRRINAFCKNLALSTLQLRSDRSLTYTFLSHSERLVLLVFPKKSKEGNESCAYSTSINIHTHIYVSSSAHLKLKRTFLKNWSSAVCCPVWCAVEMLSRAWPCYANHHHSCVIAVKSVESCVEGAVIFLSHAWGTVLHFSSSLLDLVGNKC